MLCHGAPEVGELLDESVVFRQALLEVALGMHVDDHHKAVVEDHLYRRVQIAEILRGKLLRLVHREHGLRVHAQAHVVETHGLDQRDILGGRPRFKVFARVAAFVVDLGEPFAEVDTPTQALGARKGQRGSCRSNWSDGLSGHFSAN